MTARTLITCDGLWPPPAPGPCTGKLAVKAGGRTREQVTRSGWVASEDGEQHLCPAHRRRQAAS